MGINPDVLPGAAIPGGPKSGLDHIALTDRKEFVVSPGKRLSYKVYYQQEGAGPEMDISIFKDGARVPPVMNNYVTGPRTWSSPINDTAADITYTILSWFKTGYNQGPDWDTAWLNHRGDFFGTCTAFLQFMPFIDKRGIFPPPFTPWWWEPNAYWRADVAVYIE